MELEGRVGDIPVDPSSRSLVDGNGASSQIPGYELAQRRKSSASSHERDD